MSTPQITDEYVRHLRQQHDAYKTQVAVAEAKQKEIVAALHSEFGLTIEAAPGYIAQQTQQLQAYEAQLQQQCAQLQQQLDTALASTKS